jgi:predicted ATP-dependent protease
MPEGFFDACQAVAFDGHQGVIIPASNVKNLMLRRDVVAAATEGQFAVFPIDSVDQGLDLLTGIPAGQPDANGNYPNGSLNQRIAARLDLFAAKTAELARNASALGSRSPLQARHSA